MYTTDLVAEGGLQHLWTGANGPRESNKELYIVLKS